MKTLIIGANGMLGHELATVFARDELLLWDTEEIDITDERQVLDKIAKEKPDVIINAAAYTNVDACEENEDVATRVNGDGPGFLAQVAQEIGATLVHYSTDYVFDGTVKEGYGEDAEPNPASAYGRSKLAGERAIMQKATGSLKESALHSDEHAMRSLQATPLLRYYIIRTAWLYGKHGKNFVETMLGLAEKDNPIQVVNDQTGSPTYAVDLAQATRDIIKQKAPFGIYHRTNSGSCSWYEFAKEIFEQAGLTVELSPCASDDYPRPAQRPAWSILNSTKLEPMRDWKEALKDYLHNRL